MKYYIYIINNIFNINIKTFMKKQFYEILWKIFIKNYG